MKRKMQPMDVDVEPSYSHPHLEKEGELEEQDHRRGDEQSTALTGGNGDNADHHDDEDEDGGAIDLDRLLLRPSPFGAESGALALAEFESGAELKELVGQARVLVVGAGGLGCEILKNLALSGVQIIDVIDLDTIELSNLNRQFLFREKDIGTSKAVAAAEFIMDRVTGVTVTAHHKKIQEFDQDFYRQFDIVIAGLDNIKARIWLNSMLYSLVEKDDDGKIDITTVKPLVDGGTEGFQGQARVIIPGMTACFHCTLDLFPPQQGFQLCTIADTPRQPEHCIAYAQIMQWPEANPGVTLDADIPQHVEWVMNKAQERAAKFGIQGVDHKLTLGVIKNIIPAVASTNAIIAAVSVNEALKVMTCMSQIMNNYMMYQGPEGVYTYTTAYQPKSNCIVCGTVEVNVDASPTQTLAQFIESLKTNPELQMSSPSLTSGSQTLYMQKPPALKASTRPNLEKPLGELLKDGDVVNITDPGMEDTVTVVVRFP